MSSIAMTDKTALNYQDVYPCPVCRHGEISTLPLMEAFACNFCQHIFTANLERQVLKMADSQLALSWYWNGRHWSGLRGEGTELGSGYLFAGLLFVILPTSIVAISAYLFPPMVGSPLSWLPVFWSILTFFAHLTCILWLILEYYQFPINIYFRALRRRLLSSLLRAR